MSSPFKLGEGTQQIVVYDGRILKYGDAVSFSTGGGPQLGVVSDLFQGDGTATYHGIVYFQFTGNAASVNADFAALAAGPSISADFVWTGYDLSGLQENLQVIGQAQIDSTEVKYTFSAPSGAIPTDDSGNDLQWKIRATDSNSESMTSPAISIPVDEGANIWSVLHTFDFSNFSSPPAPGEDVYMELLIGHADLTGAASVVENDDFVATMSILPVTMASPSLNVDVGFAGGLVLDDYADEARMTWQVWNPANASWVTIVDSDADSEGYYGGTSPRLSADVSSVPVAVYSPFGSVGNGIHRFIAWDEWGDSSFQTMGDFGNEAQFTVSLDNGAQDSAYIDQRLEHYLDGRLKYDTGDGDEWLLSYFSDVYSTATDLHTVFAFRIDDDYADAVYVQDNSSVHADGLASQSGSPDQIKIDFAQGAGATSLEVIADIQNVYAGGGYVFLVAQGGNPNDRANELTELNPASLQDGGGGVNEIYVEVDSAWHAGWTVPAHVEIYAVYSNGQTVQIGQVNEAGEFSPLGNGQFPAGFDAESDLAAGSVHAGDGSFITDNYLAYAQAVVIDWVSATDTTISVRLLALTDPTNRLTSFRLHDQSNSADLGIWSLSTDGSGDFDWVDNGDGFWQVNIIADPASGIGDDIILFGFVQDDQLGEEWQAAGGRNFGVLSGGAGAGGGAAGLWDGVYNSPVVFERVVPTGADAYFPFQASTNGITDWAATLYQVDDSGQDQAVSTFSGGVSQTGSMIIEEQSGGIYAMQVPDGDMSDGSMYYGVVSSVATGEQIRIPLWVKGPSGHIADVLANQVHLKDFMTSNFGGILNQIQGGQLLEDIFVGSDLLDGIDNLGEALLAISQDSHNSTVSLGDLQNEIGQINGSGSLLETHLENNYPDETHASALAALYDGQVALEASIDEIVNDNGDGILDTVQSQLGEISSSSDQSGSPSSLSNGMQADGSDENVANALAYIFHAVGENSDHLASLSNDNSDGLVDGIITELGSIEGSRDDVNGNSTLDADINGNGDDRNVANALAYIYQRGQERAGVLNSITDGGGTGLLDVLTTQVGDVDGSQDKQGASILASDLNGDGNDKNVANALAYIYEGTQVAISDVGSLQSDVTELISRVADVEGSQYDGTTSALDSDMNGMGEDRNVANALAHIYQKVIDQEATDVWGFNIDQDGGTQEAGAALDHIYDEIGEIGALPGGASLSNDGHTTQAAALEAIYNRLGGDLDLNVWDTLLDDGAAGEAWNGMEAQQVLGAIHKVTAALPDAGALSSLATAASLTALQGDATAIKAKTDNLPADTAQELTDIDSALTSLDNEVSGVSTDIGNLDTKIGTPASAAGTVSGDIADIATAVGNLGTSSYSAGEDWDQQTGSHNIAGSFGEQQSQIHAEATTAATQASASAISAASVDANVGADGGGAATVFGKIAAVQAVVDTLMVQTNARLLVAVPSEFYSGAVPVYLSVSVTVVDGVDGALEDPDDSEVGMRVYFADANGSDYHAQSELWADSGQSANLQNTSFRNAGNANWYAMNVQGTGKFAAWIEIEAYAQGSMLLEFEMQDSDPSNTAQLFSSVKSVLVRSPVLQTAVGMGGAF